MRVRYSEYAAQDLEDIFDYIYSRSTYYDRAYHYIDKLKTKCKNVVLLPYTGKQHLDLSEQPYSIIFDRKYIIFYTIHHDHILIQRIIHAKRNYQDILT